MVPPDRTMNNQNGASKPMASTTATHSLSPIRHRPLGRASTFSDLQHPLRHRRSSTFSDSVDSTRQSIRSSTDDLLFPKAHSPEFETSHEPSHWHSYPIALVLVPGLGGLFFENGAAICTDLALLFLAAIFLNWSVRMPWHWYLAARSIRVQDFESIGNGPPPDTILEEEDETEEDLSQPASPRPNNENSNQMPSEPSSGQASAASELRMHENTALLACFVFPAIGAWILHFIRAYLSRPSEGLVSNSNLTIFVLAAELRPFSHVLKMIQARTLHLQRVVASNPHVVSTGASLSVLPDLQGRVTELENYVAQAANTASSKVPSPEMTIQIRKSIQPDLDALNRAVRRYEKRQTLYTMQTESRLQELEKRLNDAITLAAAAERSTQSNRQRRSSSAMFGWMATMAVLPFQLALTVITLPGKVVMGAVGQVEVYMGKKIRREVKTAGIAGAGSGSERRRASVRGQKKAA